jgi:hypothetical protein
MTLTEQSTELDIVDTTAAASMVIAGNTPAEILTNAATIAAPLKDLIEKQRLYTSMGVDRKTGEERRHVEVSGWQAAGAMLGAMGGTPLHAQTIWTRRQQRGDDVIAYEAHVEIRTIHGDVVGAAEGMCSNAESKRRGADEYAIRSMAETRAESRAYRKAIGWIMSLAGFSPTPAEEMSETGATRASGGVPPWAAPVNDIAGVAQSLVSLLKLAGVDEGQAATGAPNLGHAVFEDCESTVPLCVARVINFISGEILNANDGEIVTPAPDEPTDENETTTDQ